MNFKKQLNLPIIYLDRNIGNVTVPGLLKQNKIPFEIHDDHLPQDAPDEDWVKLCAQKNWIVITLDKRLTTNTPVRMSAKNSGISIFVVTSGNMTGRDLGEMIAKFYQKIIRYANSSKKPFLATISRTGHIMRKQFP